MREPFEECLQLADNLRPPQTAVLSFNFGLFNRLAICQGFDFSIKYP